MADFKIAYIITKAFEGGFSNNPKDRGKETYAGITRINFPLWSGWALIDANKPVPDQLVYDFYQTEFWNKCRLNSIPNQDMANSVFDCAVNLGRTESNKFFQRAINCLSKQVLVVDGIIGSKTLAAFSSLDFDRQEACLKYFNSLRGEFYVTLTEHDNSQKEFSLGWSVRISF